MNQEIVAYNATKAALADLTARYKGLVFEVTTQKGMAEAKAAYKEINAHSITLENARKKEKAASLEYGRFVDSEAKRIDEQIEVLRLPIKEQIETETKREERELAARIEAERLRILAEQEAAKQAEEKRMADARAEIARQQAELANAAKEQARALAESRAKIEREELAARMIREEADRAARLKIEHEERIARQAREAEEAKAKAAQAAEDARLKAERDKLYAEQRAVEEAKRKEQAEAEAKAKAIRNIEEAKQREIQRKANELLDGKAMLQTFKARFGTGAEFSKVVDAINTYLESA